MPVLKCLFSGFILLMFLSFVFTVTTQAATLTVTKTADTNDGVCDADCSLREALAQANATPADDVINFERTVFGTVQTIALTTGEFSFSDNGTTTVNGPGANLLTISGTNTSRIISLNAGATATLSGLTFSGGNGVGTLNNGFGGALQNSGRLTINDSIISGNTANLNGGGISNDQGVLALNNTVLSQNTAVVGNGGALFSFGGFVTARSTRFENNVAALGGGAIFRFNSNAALDGDLTLSNSVVSGNTANGVEGGGGIYIKEFFGALNITDSIVSNNISNGGGGGVYGDVQTVNVSGSTVSGNSANGADGGAGGINGGTYLNVTNSAITGNSTASVLRGGGGLSGVNVTLSNSTVSNNSAANKGGGIYAIVTNLNHATIANNSAVNNGGGIEVNTNLATYRVYPHNSIIANNTAPAGPDIDGDVVSLGYNLIFNPSGANITGDTTGNILGQDPQLLPLAFNGGPTQTRVPQINSPAIDAGDPDNFLPTDQRGVFRPIDGDRNGSVRPDIGAFEAGALIVTKTADTNDGSCDDDCSLREALVAANNSPANDSIVFSGLFNSAQTITLTGSELTIANNGTVSIAGPGATLLTLSANNLSRVVRVNGATVRLSDLTIRDGRNIFNIGGGESRGAGLFNDGGTVAIRNAVISNNTALAYGGGVDNLNGTLVIDNSTISNNFVDAFGLGGGGISNNSGTVTITNSIFSNNHSDMQGGGILNVSGTMTVSDSTINNNNGGGGGGLSGGGIGGGTLTVNNSVVRNNTAQIGGGINVGFTAINLNAVTVSDNAASEDGGGINGGGATLTLTDSTVSNNAADSDQNGTGNGGGIFITGNVGVVINLNQSTINNNSARNGGGIYNQSSIVNLINATVANNTANNNGGGLFKADGQLNLASATISGNQTLTGVGAGIFNAGTTGLVNSRNSIIGNNNSGNGLAPDVSGQLNSQGYNLIGNTSGTNFTGNLTGNILDQDPQLLPLGDYGGPTQTIALKPTSPAIDHSDPTNFPGVDQRHAFRPADGDLNGTAQPDIGAYERFVALLTVTKTTDVNDLVCDADCSLREALAVAAGRNGSPDLAVVFDQGVFSAPQVITLSLGELQISSGQILVIKGPGANLLTINGNLRSRVLAVSGGADLTIRGVTITGGNGTGTVNGGHDGGISNFGTLTLIDSIVSGNTANGNGGGIGTYGRLSIINSTVRNNTAATIAGGGVFQFDGLLTMVNSTINNNAAAGVGGGIANISGIVTSTNSTLSNNVAGNGGGGIANFTASGRLNIDSSTISGNTATAGRGGGVFNNGTVKAHNSILAENRDSGTAPDFAGVLFSQGYNLLENPTGISITGITTGNIIGQNPRLGTLTDNGGGTQTEALFRGSPAVDSADPSSFPPTDQRSLPRPTDGDGNGTVRPDIGAYERLSSDVVGFTRFDFDGDGRADISLFRPSNGTWYRLSSGSNNSFLAAQFGIAGDAIAPTDYDGDGRTDLAVFRPSTGIWYLLGSSAGFSGLQFGQTGDVPVPADYDGDGRADIAVWRPSTGVWYILKSTGGVSQIRSGQPGDVPQVGDFDGDGRADVSLYRPSNGIWYRLNSSNNQFVAIQFGQNGDGPDAADFDGDGRTDLAVFRPSTGVWYLQQSQAGFAAIRFGQAGDTPATADFDGDGKSDVAVFRPSTGIWYLDRSTAGFTALQFGQAGDLPVPAALATGN